MRKPGKTDPVYKGRLTGVFRTADKRPLGNYTFSDFDWRHIRIDDCVNAGDVDIEAMRTGDYWYAEVLRNRRPWRWRWPWQRHADIFIPFGGNTYYEGDLYRVLVRNLVIDRGKTSFLPKDWDEAKGDVFFQLEPSPRPETVQEKTGVARAVHDTSHASGSNLVANPIHASTSSLTTDVANRMVETPAPPVVVEGAYTDTGGRVGSWATGFGRILSLLAAAVMGYYLWQSYPVLGGIFLILVLLRLALGIFNAFPWLGWLATLAILGFFGYHVFRMMEQNRMATEKLRTREGSVRVEPPRRSRVRRPDGKADSTSRKDIKWFDFSDNAYRAQYSTTLANFEQSSRGKLVFRQEARKTGTDMVAFATDFYQGLYRMDRERIRKIAKIFSDSARTMHMTPLQTAEMVVTFIQEIPYCLVHDGSCEKAVSEGNPFIVEYHAEGKPCLPEVPEGIQSPYQFLHNLKGDCDTRTLLGLAILSHLNIGSSVWVSEAYSHSILGVAVPAGNGIYKEVDGLRHYGVELTAKGYRIGMVAPDQARPGNWTVTAYNNPN